MNWKKQKEHIISVVMTSSTKSEILRRLGLRSTGGSHRQLNIYIKNWGVDTSHLKGQSWAKGVKTNRPPRNKYSDDEVFCRNSTYNPSKLRGRLLKGGYREYRCSTCGINKWNEKEITLHVDHIDGDHTNNLLTNLRFLCPNCHQQTDTWGNKMLG